MEQVKLNLSNGISIYGNIGKYHVTCVTFLCTSCSSIRFSEMGLLAPSTIYAQFSHSIFLPSPTVTPPSTTLTKLANEHGETSSRSSSYSALSYNW